MSRTLTSLSRNELKKLRLLLDGASSAPTAARLRTQFSDSIAETLAEELHVLTENNSLDSIHLSIRLLEQASSSAADARAIDLVLSGPESAEVPSRDTSVVVQTMFKSAQRSVMVVGFAVAQGVEVFQALCDRMIESPDLNVELYLNVHRQYQDWTASAVLVERFARDFVQNQWPQGPLPKVFYDPRSPDPDQNAVLHAKCVVVDEETAFVSSANFTEAAQERNIELGLKLHDPQIATRIVRHFHALCGSGQLAQLEFIG